MKLRSVTIECFRGIKNLTIDLDDTTVLIGDEQHRKDGDATRSMGSKEDDDG